jgi:hypothetical protein
MLVRGIPELRIIVRKEVLEIATGRHRIEKGKLTKRIAKAPG